jgi:hypothetical protein
MEDKIMKRFLLVVAMLLIASPVWAAVSVTATDEGSGVVAVRYNCSAGEKVRSFALDLSVDGPMTIDNIRDFNVGESKKPGGGYGIFPGSFAAYIDAANPNWVNPNYKPVATPTEPNGRAGLGTNAITVEMGSLYVDANAPGSSGLLFRLDVTSHGAADANLLIVLNNTRVGVVLEDTNIVTSPILTGTKVSFNSTIFCAVGTCGGTGAINPAITNAGFTVGTVTSKYSDTVAAGCVISQNPDCGSIVAPGSAIDYVISLGRFATPSQIIYPTYDPDCNLPIYWSAVAGAVRYEVDRSNDSGSSWTNVYSGVATYKVETVAPGLYRYRCKAANADSNSLYYTASFDCNAILSTCYKDGDTTDPNYSGWRSQGRPDCWCRARPAGQGPRGTGYQCDGDVNQDTESVGSVVYRVYNSDMTRLIANWKKTAANLTADPNVGTSAYHTNGSCADIDHKGETVGTVSYRVYNGDMSRLVANWKKLSSSAVPSSANLPGNCPR